MRQIRISAATHTGSVRSGNEDCYGATGLFASRRDGDVVSAVVTDGPCLAVVADGLGGHPCGELASAIAVEHLLKAMPIDADSLVLAVHEANRAVVDAMSPADGSVGMGTTVAAVLIYADGVATVNVGDSAVLELIDDRLVQLSTDDVPAGRATLPGLPSSIVTQTLGGSSQLVSIEPNVYEDDLRLSRRLLLCSDGLTNFVPREEIAAALGEHDGEGAISVLLALALAAGGRDNVTCLLVEVLG